MVTGNQRPVAGTREAITLQASLSFNAWPTANVIHTDDEAVIVSVTESMHSHAIIEQVLTSGNVLCYCDILIIVHWCVIYTAGGRKG